MKANWLGLVAIAASLVIIFVWIPLDVESGLVEKVRRSVVLGDALASTLASVLIGIGGILLLLETHTNSPINNADLAPSSTRETLTHALVTALIVILSLIAMRYAGPLVVDSMQNSDKEYRLLRDTAPWKYIGYMLGGTMLITGLMAWVEHKLTIKQLLTAFAASLAILIIYDLPFEDLLLPPNGDV